MEITIVGGGITGLTTALWLTKLGYKCQVFERAPKLNEVGAGVWIQPNAMKVLHKLGIDYEIRELGMSLEKVEVTNRKLKPIRKSNKKFITDGSKTRIVSIHRGRLQKALFEALPEGVVNLGMEFTSLEQNGEKLTANFGDTQIHSDIILGADGLRSNVRKSIFPESEIRYSGQTCWRGISDISFSKGELPGREAWGKRLRFGFSSLSENEVYWYAVALAPEGGSDNRDSLKDELEKRYKSFNLQIRQVIKNTPLDKIVRSDISDLKRLDQWHKGNVCLIGDAAHATTPNMGQGACQGIEDAYYISHYLSNNSNPEEAFDHFERNRRKKVDYVVNTSWRLGRMAHNPFGQSILRLVMKVTPKSVMTRRMHKLFSIQDESSLL